MSVDNAGVPVDASSYALRTIRMLAFPERLSLAVSSKTNRSAATCVADYSTPPSRLAASRFPSPRTATMAACWLARGTALPDSQL